MKFKAIVFDLDGTLVDSKIDFEAMRAELNLRPDQDVLKTIATWELAARESAHAVIHRHEKIGAQASTLINGAREFADWAKAMNVPCAIFTRNSRETALWSLEQHGFSYDVVLSREDGLPKPEPDGLFAIAARFKVQPSDMLFVGDYLYDLQAGLRAGVPTALYLPAPPDFDTTGASLLFKTYSELSTWCA